MTKQYKNIATAIQGSALPVSMMLLLVMTIISVSAMQNTVFEEKMARNTENNFVAFQAADSSINKAISVLKDDEVMADIARTAVDDADVDEPTDTFPELSSNHKPTTNNVQVAHTGNRHPNGSKANYGKGLVAHGFSIDSLAKVTNTHAASNIVQTVQKEPYINNPIKRFTTPNAQ